MTTHESVAKHSVHAQNSLGESPRWNPRSRRLEWVDIDRGEVWSSDSGGADVKKFHVGSPLGTLEATDRGTRIVTVGAAIVTVGPADEATVLGAVNGAQVRFNDSGVDQYGRLWAATMPLNDTKADCRLYRFVPGVGAVDSGVSVVAGNGIAWNVDGTVIYFSDSGAGVVYRARYDVTSASIADVAIHLTFVGCTPDGLAIDEADGLWVALWGGGRVERYASDGRLTHVVVVNTPYVTAAAFGGDAYSQLFITSARRANKDALAGDVFVAEPPFRGVPRTQVRI